MSIVKELEKEIKSRAICSAKLTTVIGVLLNKVLEGKYGTEIILNYLDLLGGDSVAFVAKYAAKGIEDKSEVQLNLFDK